MDREQIERLAIDSAAGELNADAEVLFRAYLAEHSGPEQWAREIAEVYEITDSAIEAKTSDDGDRSCPSIPTGGVQTIRPGRGLKWAAVLAIGVLAGFGAGRWNQPAAYERVVVVEVPAQTPVAAGVADMTAKYAGTFWGRKIQASLKPASYRDTGDHQQNRSLWDRYRRHVGDKRYE